jgi:hypothetical protein
LQAEQVRLYSVEGKLLKEINQPHNNKIDVSQLAAGVYIAEITARGISGRARWCKMN